MDERKNKMTDERYREILPVAYMTAAIVKGRQPRPVEVGLCARAIVDAEDENNLAYNGFPLGKVAEWLWGRKNDDGTDYWVGRRAVLYKHNDPPKEGDMSSAGYRCCVFAEALDK